MEKVSVIIPVYNAENDIIKCVNSVKNQTYPYWEVILIDDGSEDQSGNICDEYARNDERIITVHNQNSGVSSSRNCGIKRASGDFLLFIDSDDYIESDTLKKLINCVHETSAEMVICGFYYHKIKSKELIPNKPEIDFSGDNYELVSNCFKSLFCNEMINPPWNKLISRKIVIENNILFNTDYSICEDMIFSIQIISACRKIAILQECLYHYIYKQEGNLVYKFHSNFYKALCSFYNEMTKYINNYDENHELQEIIDNFFVRSTIAYLKKIYVLSGYSTEKKYQELCIIGQDNTFRDALGKTVMNEKKKRIIRKCILKRKYRLLHTLYMFFYH